jgi:ribonuclease P protein subunit POP4
MASSKETPEDIALTLISRAHPPKTAQELHGKRVIHKPLLLGPTTTDENSQDARAQRRRKRLQKESHVRRRRKPKPLSAKEKRDLGVYEISKEEQKYDLYRPLHDLWVGYMCEILDLKADQENYLTAQGVGSKLASADFHGAEICVVRSGCVGRVGCKGVVLRDTKFTFVVITEKNVLRSMIFEYIVN